MEETALMWHKLIVLNLLTSVDLIHVTVPVRVTYRLWANQRVDIEGQEQAVEKVVGQNIIEKFTVNNEDIIQVVEVVKVLCYQVT